MPSVTAINKAALDNLTGHLLHLLKCHRQSMPVVGVAMLGKHTDDKIVPIGSGNAYLHAKLVFLVCLALGDAFNFWGM